jgi:hypothetical protein
VFRVRVSVKVKVRVYACQDILSDSGSFLRQFLADDKVTLSIRC